MFSTTEITSNELISDNPIHQRLVKAYVEAAQRVNGNLLEVGCGVGRGLKLMMEASDYYTAIDKNDKLIERLQTEYPDLRFINQNIPPLSELEDNQFDFVVSFQVIEHIPQDDSFVKEIHRVLKPGGQAIITTPNRLLSLTRNPWHIREYSAEELKNLMGRSFAQVETLGVDGNEKVKQYYEQNKQSVAWIKRWDVLNLQYRLPRWVLQIPYETLNRLNRNKLQKAHDGLVSEIHHSDYFISENPAESLDLFYIGTK